MNSLSFDFDAEWWQWALMIAIGLVFLLVTPVSKTIEEFFSASSRIGKKPGVLLLTSSLVISWIFAKSISNAANLGHEFGLVGGMGYSVYYLSFLTGGWIIYRLRTQGAYRSIHHFLQSKFGRGALVSFSLLIGIRLFNEVWSNTMVIGSYFGEAGSRNYYVAILAFTALTLVYTMKGGLRSSLLTDAVQMVLFGVLLFLLLGKILPDMERPVQAIAQSGEWRMDAGLDFVFVALLQIFSYPFHDPVLTDRGFISSPKVTLKSYLLAAAIGFVCILLFSFIGIYGQSKGLTGRVEVEVSKLLGAGAMLSMNVIMVTSAASTLDSTFSSFSKLVVIDLGNQQGGSITLGRLVMVVLAVLGTLPVFVGPDILSATTISGTMVMGLAPVFLLWRFKSPRLSFHLPVAWGIAVGILEVMGSFPEALIFTTGKYASLLWANAWGLLGSFILYGTPILIHRWKEKK